MNIYELLALSTKGPLKHDRIESTANKETAVYGKSKYLNEPVCIIPHDDVTEEGFREVKANVRLLEIYWKYGAEIIQSLEVYGAKHILERMNADAKKRL